MNKVKELENMASKPVMKTYGRSNARNSAANKAFDDVVSGKSSVQTQQIKNTKWGSTSISRIRDEDPFEATYKRVKTEVESEDPFSFNPDDGIATIKEEETVLVVNVGGLGRPALAGSSGATKVDETKCATDAIEVKAEEEDVGPVFRKGPVRTYSKAKKDDDINSVTQHGELGALEGERDDDMPVLVPEKPLFLQEGGAADNFGFEDATAMNSSDPMYEEEVSSEPKRKVSTSHVSPAKGYSKKHVLQSDDMDQAPTVLNFRSQYMDPAVYSKFQYTPRDEDPVGRLNNSKVLQKSEIKHGKGSTLIVICSPKPPAEGKVKLLQQKTTRDPYRIYNVKKDKDGNSKRGKSAIDNATSADGETTSTTAAVADKTKIGSKRKQEGTETKRVNKIFRSRNTRSQNKIEPEVKEEENEESEKPSNGETGVNIPAEEGSTENASPAEATAGRNVFDSFGLEDSEESKKSSDILETPTEPAVSSDEPEPMDTSEQTSSQKSISSQEQSEENHSEVEELESSQDVLESSQGSTDGDTPKSVSETKKEKKIFKSKNKVDLQKKVLQNTMKRSPSKAVYNMRSWHENMDEEERVTFTTKGKLKGREGTPPAGPPKLTPETKPAEAKDTPPSADPPKLSRAVHWANKDGEEAYTSLHVNKEHKELFTVVKNVKEAHECQEIGETQEFSDDVEYLLAGLKEGEPMSTRCLSCIGLAQKCIIPAFRMHLRAHGTVTKIFGHLKDACSDPSLALCTALLMFMLSRDRLNMDLDTQSLDLMLKLLGIDNQEQLSATMTATSKRALNRNMERVKEVYLQLQLEAGTGPSATDVENVSTGYLAMESLLSLTSRRAGEWFKEELRSLGALDHIVDSVCSCIEVIGDDTTLLTDATVENMKKVDRCLRVLENVTFLNTENQTYLITYKQGILVQSMCKAMQTCIRCLPVYPMPDSDKIDKASTGFAVYSCMIAILKVLLNITHENELGSSKAGEQPEFVNQLLTCILQTPQHVPVDMRFDLLVLSIGLMINLVEHCDVNRRKIIEAKTIQAYEFEKHGGKVIVAAPKALVQVFRHRFDIAKKMEEQDFVEAGSTPQASPNKSGEWKESDSGIEWVVSSAKKAKEGEDSEVETTPLKPATQKESSGKKEDEEEDTFTKALHRAGKHMENSIIAAYVALLLGCVIQDNTIFVDNIKSHLPDGSFDDMITILKKFLEFMNLTTAVGSSGGKSIAHVIEVLEGC